jgi:hypothetical protein
VVEFAPTPPSVCGLALALPMDFAAIESALNGGAYADYVGRAASIGPARRIWEHGFGKVAAAAAALAGEAAGLGVTVSSDTTLADLARLFERCAVVTLVAHWRGPQLDAADIRLDAGPLIDRLGRENSPTAELIRSGLPPDWSDRLARADAGAAQTSLLAEILDQRLRQPPCLLAAPDGVAWDMDEATLRHANRAALDAWGQGAFVPGNRIELADGLHAAEQIAACVPPSWSGVADLSNCQSAQLIEWIKQARPDRIVIANERETNPLRRVALLRVIYELLAKTRSNYADARIALSEAMVADTP